MSSLESSRRRFLQYEPKMKRANLLEKSGRIRWQIPQTAYEASIILLKTKTVLKGIKTLRHKKASEVVRFSLSYSDSTWKRKADHGLPIGYYFKGYS